LNDPSDEPPTPKPWWQGLPAILTGLAAVITGLTGLVVALQGGDPAVVRDLVSHAETDGAATHASAPQPPPAAPAQTPAPPPVTPAEEGRRAFIDDPDGYTNVRAAPDGNARILTRVLADEPFRVLSSDGSWWQVRTASGEIGYMHRSRIRLATD
jgi:hypothetical protein